MTQVRTRREGMGMGRRSPAPSVSQQMTTPHAQEPQAPRSSDVLGSPSSEIPSLVRAVQRKPAPQRRHLGTPDTPAHRGGQHVHTADVQQHTMPETQEMPEARPVPWVTPAPVAVHPVAVPRQQASARTTPDRRPQQAQQVQQTGAVRTTRVLPILSAAALAPTTRMLAVSEHPGRPGAQRLPVNPLGSGASRPAVLPEPHGVARPRATLLPVQVDSAVSAAHSISSPAAPLTLTAVPFAPASAPKYETHSVFTDHAVTRGSWRLEVVPPAVTGLARPLEIYRARRSGSFIKFAWHGDRNTFCPPIWYDLAIGSGACGLGCRHCFLMLTFRSMRDPNRHVVYDNVDAYEHAVRSWLRDPSRRRQHTLGLGIDCSDSLLYEGLTGHAQRLIPLFANAETNPRGCKLILLTKSANTPYLAGLPTTNIAVTFSLNPEEIADKWEGKWADGTRITPLISTRLAAARDAQQMGFEVRFRIDPILPIGNWREAYRAFFREVVGLGVFPTYITLGTYREKNAQLDFWRAAWGLPAAEWDPEELPLQQDGTHRHLPEAERIAIYQAVHEAVEAAWARRSATPAVELCKETHVVRNAVGFSCTAQCNCLQ